MEAKANFDSAHTLLSFTDFFVMFIYDLFLHWIGRINKLRSRCLPFLECLADSFAVLDGKNNNMTSTGSKVRTVSTAIQDVGARPVNSTAVQTAENCSSSSLTVTGEEVGMLIAKMGLQQLRQDYEKEVMGVDDVASLFEDKEPSLEEVSEAFQVFDKNGDGYIDAHELMDVLSVLGFQEGSSIESCKEMIATFDENRDGRVDFPEFVTLMGKGLGC